MGSLNPPTSGRVYLDTSVLIYTVEKHPQFAQLLRPMWEAFQAGTVELVTSEISVLEALVGPLKRNDVQLIGDYDDLLLNGGIDLVVVARPVLREAARLRATVASLRTPDAIHVATAHLSGCTTILSNDTGLQAASSVPVVLLSDLIA